MVYNGAKEEFLFFYFSFVFCLIIIFLPYVYVLGDLRHI